MIFDKEAIFANVTTFKFDGKRLWQILTSPSFPESDALSWVDEHFYLTIQVSILYVAVIFGIKFLMKNRAPFELSRALNVWNLFLACFSIAGTLSLTPDYFGTIQKHGWIWSFCRNYNFTSGITGYWVWLFVISKLIELFDTVFLVLRKRPLVFLHWYHHVLTLIYTFYSYPHGPGFNRWGFFYNYCVHSFMYSYYFLRSMKIKVPGFVAQLITTLQIAQFVICVVLIVYLGFMVYVQDVQCDCEQRPFMLAVFMDFTYLLLFINFFYQSYIHKGGKSKYRVDKKEE